MPLVPSCTQTSGIQGIDDMKKFRILAMSSAVALLAATSAAQADAVSIDFTTMSLGQLPGGLDARSAGNANQWYVPDNAATYGEVRDGVGRWGSRGLVVGNRGNGNDGVVDNVKSGRLADKAGETSVAPNNTFESTYWFRSASTAADNNFAFKTESWGTDRTTFLGFFAVDGKIQARAVGINASGIFSPTILSSGLDWGDWYQVVTRISFVDGGGVNDIVEFSIFDASNALLGSTSSGTTWEYGQRVYGYNAGMTVAPDAIGFQARFSSAGETVYVDDVSWRSFNVPEPGSVALVLAAGLAALGASRRKRRC